MLELTIIKTIAGEIINKLIDELENGESEYICDGNFDYEVEEAIKALELDDKDEEEAYDAIREMVHDTFRNNEVNYYILKALDEYGSYQDTLYFANKEQVKKSIAGFISDVDYDFLEGSDDEEVDKEYLDKYVDKLEKGEITEYRENLFRK